MLIKKIVFPDRHSNASDAEKAEHEKKFKELGEAYTVLSDPKKRALHDQGHDVNDPEAGYDARGCSISRKYIKYAFLHQKWSNYFIRSKSYLLKIPRPATMPVGVDIILNIEVLDRS